jgi:Transcriptional regulator
MSTFVDILFEKGFDKITISDIADRANLNRGTIYLHYLDKFDLLDKCIESHVMLLFQYCANSTNKNINPIAIQSIFEYLEKNFEIYQLFLKNDVAGYFHKRMYDSIKQITSEVILFNKDNSENANVASIQFLTSGFLGVLEWWLNNSMPCNVQQITEQLLLLFEPFSKHLLP